MSSYTAITRHPETGVWEDADWMDNFYGSRHYGVKFADGKVYNPERVKLHTRNPIGWMDEGVLE